MKLENVIAEARRNVKAMDAIDRRAGVATPSQCGRDEVIETAAVAFNAAATRLKTGDIKTAVSCAADALVMLEELKQSPPKKS